MSMANGYEGIGMISNTMSLLNWHSVMPQTQFSSTVQPAMLLQD